MSSAAGRKRRRGPDAGGLFLERHVALGHRRLAVIGLDGGVQPMRIHGRLPGLPIRCWRSKLFGSFVVESL
jgi:asparagine synthetase B (glutamine-hydrolysing)